MNKTVSVNISGIFFHIDEDAYARLEEYLNTLKAHFGGQDGGEEVLQDIESRIAEIFQGKLHDRKQLILSADVEEVISILGKPDDIAGEEVKQQKKSGKKEDSLFRKRLFRDEEGRVLGGVCSGLGHYFDIDPVWIRIAFILALFIGGASAVVYLALWIIVPVARTTEERLDMKGEPYTIADIQRNIKEEMEELRKRFRHMKKGARSGRDVRAFKLRMQRLKQEMRRGSVSSENARRHSHSFLGVLGEIIYYSVKALMIALGILFIIIGTVFLIAVIGMIAGADGIVWVGNTLRPGMDLPDFFGFIFSHPQQVLLALVAIAALLGIPLIMMVFNGVRMVLGFRGKIRVISITATFLWLAGLLLAIYVATPVFTDFRKKETVISEESLALSPGKTLYIKSSAYPVMPQADNEDADIVAGDWYINDGLLMKTCELKISLSPDTLFHLDIEKTAAAANAREARLRAGSIPYRARINDTLLVLDNMMTVPPGQPWRRQDVKVFLSVPAGKSVNFDASLVNLDSRGAWNHQMLGKTMTMGADGKLK